MEKDVIKTNIGHYEVGTPIAITMQTGCGRHYTYKGTIEGTRWCRGKEYLVMKSPMDERLYDVSLDGTVSIVTGDKALEVSGEYVDTLNGATPLENSTPKYNRI